MLDNKRRDTIFCIDSTSVCTLWEVCKVITWLGVTLDMNKGLFISSREGIQSILSTISKIIDSVYVSARLIVLKSLYWAILVV